MGFLYDQFFGQVTLPTNRLDGRTVIVTGSNIGLGFHSAVHLARLNPKLLILAVRSIEKGEAAKAKIASLANYPEAQIEVWQLDLSSFDNVKAFAKRCSSDLERLDIIVENAAIATLKWGMTNDGWEQTVQVNDLSTGLLALLVLPVLRKTAKLPAPAGSDPDLKPHLTFVGSEVHAWAKFAEAKVPGSTLSALNDEKNYVSTDRYNISKLLNIYLARETAKICGSEIVVNVVNPGLCVSELRRDLAWPIAKALDMLAHSGEKGATNIAWAATQDTSATPGGYISYCKVVKPDKVGTEEELALEQKVWGEMVEVWKKVAGTELNGVLA